MRRIKYIIKKEFLQLSRDKKLLVPVLLSPFTYMLLLGYAVTLDIKNISISVYDMSNGYFSRKLISAFTSSGYFELKFKTDNYRDIEENIDNNHISMGLIIPQDFERNLLAEKTTPVQLIIDGSDANTATIGLSYAKQVIVRFTRDIMQGKSLSIKITKIDPQFRSWYNQELKSKYFIIPGVIGLLLMIVSMLLTSMVIVKEREIGTMEQLIVTPIKPIELIIGKLTPFLLIGFFDVTLILSVSYFWFEIPIKGSIFLLYILSGAFILTMMGLGLFISTISKTQQQAMLAANFIFMMPFLYLSGFVFPIENMPKILQYITYLVPLRYYLEIVRGIFLKGMGISLLWVDFLILFLSGVAILAINILRFSKRIE